MPRRQRKPATETPTADRATETLTGSDVAKIEVEEAPDVFFDVDANTVKLLASADTVEFTYGVLADGPHGGDNAFLIKATKRLQAGGAGDPWADGEINVVEKTIVANGTVPSAWKGARFVIEYAVSYLPWRTVFKTLKKNDRLSIQFTDGGEQPDACIVHVVKTGKRQRMAKTWTFMVGAGNSLGGS